MSDLHPKYYFDFSEPSVRQIFDKIDVVWDILPHIGTLVRDLLNDKRVIKGDVMPGAQVADGPIYVGKGAVIEPGAYVVGPTYIGDGVIIRHGAYVRGNVILLNRSIVGHATEAKNAIFLPGARAPHFAYVGDSVLGHGVNLGAGVKLSNLAVIVNPTLDASAASVKISVDNIIMDTGFRKFGAILGDNVQVGCNTVLNPGTVVGPESVIYPNATLSKGVYPSRTIIKVRQSQLMTEVISSDLRLDSEIILHGWELTAATG